MTTTIKSGATARATAVFRTVGGTLADPSTITFRWRDPTGAETSYVYGVDGCVCRHSTGVYYCDRPMTSGDVGTWHARGVGAGAVTAADEAIFVVVGSSFATP